MKLKKTPYFTNPVIFCGDKNKVSNPITPNMPINDKVEISYLVKHSNDPYLKDFTEKYGKDYTDFVKEVINKQQKTDIKITPRMLSWFYTIDRLKNEKIYDQSYELMQKELNIEGASPKLKIIPLPGNILYSLDGDYNPIMDLIRLNQKLIGVESKGIIIESLRHELEHFNQSALIARTEGLGISAIARVYAQQDMDECLNSKEPVNLDLYREITQLKQNGVDFETSDGKKIAKKLEEAQYNSHMKKLEDNNSFKEIIKRFGIVAKDSPEGLKANEYLKALQNYDRWSNADLLEIEARSAAKKFIKEIVNSHKHITNILKKAI